MSKTLVSPALTREQAVEYASDAIRHAEIEKVVVEKTGNEIFKVTRIYAS